MTSRAPRVLLAWIGKADLRAPLETDRLGLGPIAQAVQDRSWERVVLLNNYPADDVREYLSWLRARTDAPVAVAQIALTSPTDFGEIYRAALAVANDVLGGAPAARLTFHLSPGTPAMAAVWIIIGKTRVQAELIESSRQHGVRTVAFPFDIAADFIPDVLRRSDRDLQRLSAGLPPESPAFSAVVHRSAVMQRLIARAERVAVRSIPVLLEGESGTGKELFARAIHRASPRQDRPFIVVNCGAIPPDLVEAHLFGHERGAFTGALQPHEGHFEAADHGTLFLDEIGELPLPAQVKLLRVLQDGEVVRIGATRAVHVDVRVIAATNRVLTREVADGRFREDLFYRLAVAVLRLPPLRDRPGDLGLLIDHALDQVNKEATGEPGHEPRQLSAGARNLLLNHHWPGNVRELLNTMRRLTVWSPGPVIRAEDVRDALLATGPGAGSEILHRPLGEGFELPALLSVVARHYLERGLDEAGGNKTKAATLLGLPSYQTLTNWLRRHGVRHGT